MMTMMMHVAFTWPLVRSSTSSGVKKPEALLTEFNIPNSTPVNQTISPVNQSLSTPVNQTISPVNQKSISTTVNKPLSHVNQLSLSTYVTQTTT